MIQSDGSINLIACNDCGQLVQLPELKGNMIARCARCDAKLSTSVTGNMDRTLALTFTSLILFIIANCYPFLAIQLKGFVQETNLITGIFALIYQGMPWLALLVFATIFVIPLFQILGLIYIYLPLKLGYIPWKTAFVFRTIRHLQPWGMLEIYMLGILVSLVKLAKMATIIPGFASGAFMVLICVLAATLSGINPNDIWKRLPIKKDRTNKNNNIKLILAGCNSCSLLSNIDPRKRNHFCPRCQAALHIRKPGSIQRTWALVIAAAILYVPANILPITVTSTLLNEKADTIMSGVIYFLFSGSWAIASIIFIASIAVPLLKLFILCCLLISVQTKSNWKPEDRTRLYRITEAVGRWSMLDIFVVTILISLVQLGPLANIQAGPAAVYFCAVVVITMFAAESFDPRLIWDAMEENNEPT